MDKYEILNVDITTIGDTKKLPRKQKPTSFIAKFFQEIAYKIMAILKVLGYQQPYDPWNESVNKSNQLVSMRLRDKNTEKVFCVGTYHMPCAFRHPALMMIHCALSAQHVQKFAKSDPYVYTGDFNIKPDSSMYQLLTEGKVEANNPDLPAKLEGDNWDIQVKPLRSAYKIGNGKEPEFTNWAQTKDQEDPFIGTLDYIFISDEWRVDQVKSLPSQKDVIGPFPIETEPSDHLLVSASLSL